MNCMEAAVMMMYTLKFFDVTLLREILYYLITITKKILVPSTPKHTQYYILVLFEVHC